jgi:hypothetical protein
MHKIHIFLTSKDLSLTQILTHVSSQVFYTYTNLHKPVTIHEKIILIVSIHTGETLVTISNPRIQYSFI